ncbi:hypothetical protein [Streptomyces violaceusniger]|uniref:Uncharacterized protein n=1 Tax=Streptomyces violaceusniger (strain Tu 4113) TaxID=653045 RepID=G2PE02_STRV4|nr:hypothetical protein [Streptomyces violaceusniger]AEM82830.1 hypothetical protein Strvi_3134 [Streptomyces violaceusniger Tu 4113]
MRDRPDLPSAAPQRPQVLAIVERAYRGAVEKQFADALYLALELHRQLGGIDILLRGQAVTYAARDAHVPPLRLGNRVIETLTDPRGDVLRLLDAGVRVYAEEPGLAAYGLDGEGRLLDRVRPMPADEAAARWSTYRMVCFM